MIKRICDVEDGVTVAYTKEYLVPTMDLVRLVFIQMNESNDLDIWQQIDAYMRTSNIRIGMDQGLQGALDTGWKQIYNSVDMTGINAGEKTDDIMLHWIADIYTYWQWRYCVTSKEISEKCDAKMLSKLYYPLHEASIQCACRKLQKRFFGTSEEEL